MGEPKNQNDSSGKLDSLTVAGSYSDESLLRAIASAPACPIVNDTADEEGARKSDKYVFQPGEIVSNRYEIVKELDEGGMGAIYLARQIGLVREVAIKAVPADVVRGPDLLARFQREALVLQKLTHPNTVRIYDFGVTETGHNYLVMEYLKGIPLSQFSHRGEKLAIARVTRIGTQVLRSLVEAHSQGIVHRDIKPSNLMLCEQAGETDFVKLIDFGIARSEVSLTTFRTATNVIVGSPHYMAPEQLSNSTVDARSDIYSLGLTLFELAVGRPAYSGKTHTEIAFNHLKPDPLEIPSILAGSTLGQVIRKAAEKQPDDRYQSAGSMLEALVENAKSPVAVSHRLDQRQLPPASADAVGAMPLEAEDASVSEPTRVIRGRNVIAIAVGLLLLVMLAVVLLLNH